MSLQTSYPIQNCITKCSTVTKLPSIEYDGDSIDGYSWYFGDGVLLRFHLTGEVIDTESGTYQTIDEFFYKKDALFTISDFRGIVVFQQTVPAQEVMEFPIDEKISSTIVPGVYTGKLVVMGNPILQTTIFNSPDIKLVVK